MIDWLVDLPTWGIIRSLGIVSYLMLGLGICFGILYSWPNQLPKNKLRRYKLHTFFTVGGTAVGLLHGAVTVVDAYMPFAWREVLVPFQAARHPVLNGLGTLAGYGSLMLIFTSDIRNKLRKKLWRAIHLFSYPIFAMAFVHGFFLGTDTANDGMKATYFASLLAVLGLTVARGMTQKKPDRKRSASPGTIDL